MTLQDLIEASNNTLVNFGRQVLPLLLPIFAAVLLFLVGLVLAHSLTLVINELLRLLSLEKTLQQNSGYKTLTRDYKTLNLTNLVSQLVWWGTLVLFLSVALEVAGFSETNLVLGRFVEFVPQLVSGSLTLIFGMLLAYLAWILVTAFGNLSRLAGAALLARVVSSVIMVFSLLQSLVAFGVSSQIISFLILAAIAATALAAGLAGKDFFSDTLKKFKDLKL